MNAKQKARQRARDRAADGIATREECVATKDERAAFAKRSATLGMSPRARTAYYRAQKKQK